MKVTFLRLTNRYLFEPSQWPRFTQIGQALGSIVLANETIMKLCPDIFIDTLGLGFAYPWVRFFAPSNTILLSYTHYPAIQSDMI